MAIGGREGDERREGGGWKEGGREGAGWKEGGRRREEGASL